MVSDWGLRAVLFDLDDTLLFSDMENQFLGHYFALLTEYARPLLPPQQLIGHLLAATAVMQSNSGRRATNEQVFAAAFAARLERPWEELQPFFARFYKDQFPRLRVHTRTHPQARPSVEMCRAAGYRLAIATNPLFPARAIEQRMDWAGVADLDFDLVTTYENMHTAKPSPDYYLEIAERLDLPPAACLMVGNDLSQDIAPAQAASMRTFWANEWPQGPQVDVHPDGQGNLDQFMQWMVHPF